MPAQPRRAARFRISSMTVRAPQAHGSGRVHGRAVHRVVATYAAHRFLLRFFDRIPKPDAVSSTPACADVSGACSAAAVLAGGPKADKAAQINSVNSTTGCPSRFREHRRREDRCREHRRPAESRIAQVQNVSRMVVNPETNTRLLKMSSKPAPGTKLDTPLVITIFSVNGGRY